MLPSVEQAPPRDALVCVDPTKAAAIWPHVRAFIASAYAKVSGDDTLEAIEADVRAGHSLLWVVWDGSGIIAAATTKIMQTPSKKVLRIECAGGRELPRWIAFIRDLEAYGKKAGCDVIRIEGREGWKTMFPDYRQPWIVLEKVL